MLKPTPLSQAKCNLSDYSQILNWVLDLKGPCLLGVNGPQGSGKSTLCAWLCEELTARGRSALAISIDDFYLRRSEQVLLAARFGENPYLQARGYPGTHDVELGSDVLKGLKAGQSVLIPRYDKSLFEGRGDRLPETQWTRVDRAYDVIFLEGWMLGFPPVPAERLPNSHFVEINNFLRAYTAWTSLLDGFLQLVPDEYHHVLAWRVEAEEKMKASGRPGLSAADIRAYIELFLPAYKTYLPALADHPPVQKNFLRVPISRARLSR